MQTTIKPETKTIDATGQAPGRLATEIVKYLMGKHKASYTPNIDAETTVEVVHAKRASFSPKKLSQKVYTRHSGYQGGLKEKRLSDVHREDPGDAIRRAVSRMLPKNRLRSRRLKRLIITNE